MTLNLAPMVDVMMCLIIFFLLGSALVDQSLRPVNLPFAESAAQSRGKEVGRRVVVNVRNRADDPHEAEYVVMGWTGERAEDRVLYGKEIEGYLEGRAILAGEARDELRCVIRADKDVPYAAVEQVLRGCGLAKIRKIVFSANPRADVAEVRP
jgi:biopolymer transport protein ExbD